MGDSMNDGPGSSRMRRSLIGLWVLAVLGASACGMPAPDATADMARMHEDARAMERNGDTEGALRLYDAAAVAGAGDSSPRAQALRQDSLFALGRAQLALARPDEALATARRGLVLGEPQTVFVANLLALEATSLEALGRPLDALPSYERALDVHAALLTAALDDAEQP